MITVRIKEESFIALIASRVLKTNRVAIVINHTIHLHNASRESFIQNQPWLLHELRHVAQYEHYGLVRFTLLYLYESVAKGYRENRFEVQARAAEQDVTLLDIYKVV